MCWEEGLDLSKHLQVLVILGQGGVLRLLDVLLNLLLPLGVHGHLEQMKIVRMKGKGASAKGMETACFSTQ